MKDDQRSNTFLAIGLPVLVIVVITFIVALMGSKAGEVSAALATLIAGIMALIAGVLVYRAAMASRNDLQNREREDDRRRKLNLFLKAEHMAYILMQVAPLGLNSARLAFSKLTPEGQSVPGHMSATDIRIPRPKQLDELWENLSEFPPNAIYEMRYITQCFDQADEYLKNTELVPGNMESPLVNYYNSITESARVLGRLISDTDLMKTYCVENPDRYGIIYGDPDEDG